MTPNPNESYLERDLRERPEIFKRASPLTLAALHHDWDYNARQNQKQPPGAWRYWMILAGRGFGKSRTGAEWVRAMAKVSRHMTLVGATANDARTIMVEGESGILACCPDGERPKYMAHKGELHWPNGAKSQVMSADEPERFRGKQHEIVYPPMSDYLSLPEIVVSPQRSVIPCKETDTPKNSKAKPCSRCASVQVKRSRPSPRS